MTNVDQSEGAGEVLSQATNGQLKSLVERVERLLAEKAEIEAQVKEVMAEGKSSGFDVKIIRRVIKIRKTDRAKLQEEDALTDLYLSATGDLPLFERQAQAGSTISTITLGMDNGRSVTATPNEVRQALSQVTDDEDLYRQAVEIVRTDAKPSVSYIQRKLQIGYNRAVSFIERMEKEGIIGPANHAGVRAILLAA